MAVTKDIKIN